jgi:triosephosphate isomerase
MNKTVAEGVALANELKPLVADASCDVAVCPTYAALYSVGQALEGSNVALGAQNFFWEKSGAYTGFISGPMLKDCGCAYVILGHSEARGRFGVKEDWMTDELMTVFGDNDATVNKKAKTAFEQGLIPIVCCGELLSERQAGETDAVVSGQIEAALNGLSEDQVTALVIAYEPVWAIGTGEVCAADEADRVCGVIRETVKKLYGAASSEAVRIQYGGSVKPDNAKDLLSRENIDGALVGGASLKAGDFAAIVKAAP